MMQAGAGLVDQFGRRITYVRLSVTDRCDFRCVYCMAEEMTFVPRDQVLSLEEIAEVGRGFVAEGVTKLRLTGGEPLVRRGLVDLASELGALPGLRELCMTTNGARLGEFAEPLARAGVSRVNISLDSLDPDRFRELTRIGKLEQVLDGIRAAQAAGFKRIKLNAVVLKGRNDDEVHDLVDFALTRGLDLTFIEEMPLGAIEEHDRAEAFCSSAEIRERLAPYHQLIPVTDDSGGPARYYRIPGYESRIGFISPHSHNFCGDCNRVRVTAEGRLLLCLGNEHSMDLRAILREHPGDQTRLRQALQASMAIKPERHTFNLEEPPQVLRFMNATGG
jgi:cyclic pyranopterin phosphate synthase